MLSGTAEVNPADSWVDCGEPHALDRWNEPSATKDATAANTLPAVHLGSVAALDQDSCASGTKHVNAVGGCLAPAGPGVSEDAAAHQPGHHL